MGLLAARASLAEMSRLAKILTGKTIPVKPTNMSTAYTDHEAIFINLHGILFMKIAKHYLVKMLSGLSSDELDRLIADLPGLRTAPPTEAIVQVADWLKENELLREARKHAVAVLKGVDDHECGHINYTDSAAWVGGLESVSVHPVYQQYLGLFRDIMNMMEDYRINRCMAVDFPGSRKFIRLMYEWLFKDDEHPPVSLEYPAGLLVLQEAHVCLCTGKQPMDTGNPEWNDAISKITEIGENARLGEHTNDAVFAAFKTLDIIMPLLPDPAVYQQQSPDQENPGTKNPQKAPQGEGDYRKIRTKKKSKPQPQDEQEEQSSSQQQGDDAENSQSQDQNASEQDGQDANGSQETENSPSDESGEKGSQADESGKQSSEENSDSPSEETDNSGGSASKEEDSPAGEEQTGHSGTEGDSESESPNEDESQSWNGSDEESDDEANSALDSGDSDKESDTLQSTGESDTDDTDESDKEPHDDIDATFGSGDSEKERDAGENSDGDSSAENSGVEDSENGDNDESVETSGQGNADSGLPDNDSTDDDTSQESDSDDGSGSTDSGLGDDGDEANDSSGDTSTQTEDSSNDEADSPDSEGDSDTTGDSGDSSSESSSTEDNESTAPPQDAGERPSDTDGGDNDPDRASEIDEDFVPEEEDLSDVDQLVDDLLKREIQIEQQEQQQAKVMDQKDTEFEAVNSDRKSYGKLHQNIHVETKTNESYLYDTSVLERQTGRMEETVVRGFEDSMKRKKSRYRSHLLEGEIDPIRLIQDEFGEDRIFRQSLRRDKTDTVVVVMTDESGSMQAHADGMSRFQAATGANLLLHGVLRRMNIPHQQFGFSAFYGRNAVLHRPYVMFENCNQPKVPICCGCFDNARDGLSIRLGAQMLLQRPERQKLLIVVTDGIPEHAAQDHYYTDEVSLFDTANAVQEAERLGVKVVGVSIGDGDNHMPNIYSNRVCVRRLSELPQKLVQVLQQTLQ